MDQPNGEHGHHEKLSSQSDTDLRSKKGSVTESTVRVAVVPEIEKSEAATVMSSLKFTRQVSSSADVVVSVGDCLVSDVNEGS